MQLFPEREGRGRRTLALAVVLSLIVHFSGSALWPLFARTFAHASPDETAIAQTEPITIERLPSPTPVPSPTATPPPLHPAQVRSHTARTAPAASQHRLARLLAATPRAVPTLAPPPPVTVAHTSVVFHQPVERRALVPAAGSRTNVLAPNQIAQYEGAFRRTIAQMHGDGLAPGARGASGPRSRTQELLGGTFGEEVDFSGTCRDYAPSIVRGAYIYHYLSCHVAYSDGFAELASYPWPFRFPVDADPIGRGGHFPEATPPPGFVLPPEFEPSRRVCTFYHDACAKKLAPSAAAP